MSRTLAHRSWDLDVGAYGVTVDSKGYVWTCSGNASRFDPMTETWQRMMAGEYGGCMEDGAGTLYKATPGGIVAIDTTTLAIFTGLVGAYTYSDMTGFALSTVGVP